MSSLCSETYNVPLSSRLKAKPLSGLQSPMCVIWAPDRSLYLLLPHFLNLLQTHWPSCCFSSPLGKLFHLLRKFFLPNTWVDNSLTTFKSSFKCCLVCKCTWPPYLKWQIGRQYTLQILLPRSAFAFSQHLIPSNVLHYFSIYSFYSILSASASLDCKVLEGRDLHLFALPKTVPHTG